MLHQGPVPPFVHGVIEYAVARAVHRGALPVRVRRDLRHRCLDRGRPGAARLHGRAPTCPPAWSTPISVGVHVTADIVLAVLLVALPFVLGFRDETAPTALFITVGVLHLLVTIATRFRVSRR